MDKNLFSLKGLKMPSKEKMEEYYSKACDELMADPFVRKFLQDNQLDESFISEHIIFLLQMMEENKPCLSCQNYLGCKKTPKGYQTIITIDDENYELAHKRCDKFNEVANIIDCTYYRDYPDEWLYNSMDKVSMNAGRKLAIKECLTVLTNDSKQGIYLYGKSGTGKSYIIAALANDLIRIYNYRVAFVNVRSFIEDCKASFNSKDDYVGDQINKLQRIDVVIFDDFGGEKMSDWSTHNVLFEIIDYRSKMGKLTCFTSMYKIEELLKAYGGSNPRNERLISRILASAKVVELTGFDLVKFANKKGV